MKALIVDDDHFSLKLLASQLRQRGGYVIESCDSAEHALELIRSKAFYPDIIFLDLNMPGMDGPELIGLLGKMEYRGGLVLVSGYSKRILHATVELSKEHQVSILGYLEKPVSPAQLDALSQNWRLLDGNERDNAFFFTRAEFMAAIANREFVNHYQPKISLSDNRVTGVEALVRWMHPEHGLMGPGQFISLAEQYGCINALTRLVVENALQDRRRWKGDEAGFSMSINISMLSLSSMEFMDGICRQITESGCAPEDFIFEVTESRTLDDQRQPLEIMIRLKLQGFRLAIDDFGTVYSNLSKLKDYPFDELKLDRSFIDGVSTAKSKFGFYHACLALAGEYDMTLVAEGIENRQDLMFLKESGCDLGQGYLIARPMAAEALGKWLAEYRGVI
ncbi:EAL domain-containing response regulator [Oceanimonas marisflavi]|uniref:EAL domain-containing response regulator n=1 Tax=Oceanimonas marisflavi TaxID=2059724 RepID=UPI0018E52B69|nr:EAL domain-containing response regulator [Oceanimonas marisflavi]